MTADSPSGSWCPRPRGLARGLPDGPRALDRTARVLSPRWRCSTWFRTTLTLVVGAGTLGVIRMWALRRRRARGRAAVEARRRLAAELGADAVLEPGADVEAALGSRRRAALVTVPRGHCPGPRGRRRRRVGSVFAGSPAALRSTPSRALPPPAVGGRTGSTLADYRRARDIAASGSIPQSDFRREPSLWRRSHRSSSTPTPTPERCASWRDRRLAARGGGSVADRREGPIRVALIGYGLAGAVFHGPLVSSTPGWRSRRS